MKCPKITLNHKVFEFKLWIGEVYLSRSLIVYSAGHGNLPVELCLQITESTDETSTADNADKDETKNQALEDSIYNFNAILDAVGDDD
jgi:hypothetical protein